jgi:WD40 repeat protein/CheY-like chemotaxis protein
MTSKILIVENERLIARDIQQRLQQLGYQIVGIASSYQTALESVTQYLPDLVLMDIRLKGEVDGIAAAAEIRKHFDLPVVFVTAHADEATLEQAKSVQPFGYLVKPIETQNLRTTIEIALTRHQTEKAIRKTTIPWYAYQVGGSLSASAPSYVVREADYNLYESLINGNFCYVFNSRQMGKSSLRVRTKHRLEKAGCSCASIDLTNIGSEVITPQQWYKGVAYELWRSFNLLTKVNLKLWWQEQESLSPIQLLSRFIEEILLEQVVEEKIFIFIDEIDSVLGLNFPLDDFFAFIRYCHNQRVDNPKYNRLTFALFGVATPSDLIRDNKRTPFNIGKAIELYGFKVDEIAPLVQGLEAFTSHPFSLIVDILNLTGGQPFLTQKICQLIVKYSAQESNKNLSKITTSKDLEELVNKYIINHWESQDEPEHLKTIRDRILSNEERSGVLLGLYHQILTQGYLLTDDSKEQGELLLSGLVVKSEGKLLVRNRIYQAVFNLHWLEKQLSKLRPYAKKFEEWVKSDCQDYFCLLRGQSLKYAQFWSQGKNLSHLDYQYLAASEQLDRQEMQKAFEAQRTLEIAARLKQEQKNTKLQRLLLGVVSLAFLVSAILGLMTYWQSRRAIESQIEAIATSSDSLFALNKKLEALIQAVKAKKLLDNLGGTNQGLKDKVKAALLQAVYGADEFYRFSGSGFSIAVKSNGNDGIILASDIDRKNIQILDTNGSLLKKFSAHDATILHLSFSPDSNLLASASADKTAKIWKHGGNLVSTLKGHTASIWQVAFSPDSRLLATASDDGTVKIWDIDGTLIHNIQAHSAAVWSVAFSPDGKFIASSSSDKSIKLWELSTQPKQSPILVQKLLGHQNFVRSIAFSPDGQTLASGSDDNTIKLWRREKDEKFAYLPIRTITGHNAAVQEVLFSPDSQKIASASWDTTIKIWNKNGILQQTLNGHTERLRGVGFSADGKIFASTSEDRTIRLWNLKKLPSHYLNDHKAAITTAVFSHDGAMIADGSDDQTIKIWKPDGTLLQTLTGHTASVLGLTFSRDNQILVSSSWDNTIKLWQFNPKNRQYNLIKTLGDHKDAVWEVAFTPDSQLFVSSSADNTIKIWTKDGHLLQSLSNHTDEVRDIAVSPNGKYIASASLDKTVKLWTIDGKLLYTLKGHTAGVLTVAFSPDSQHLASGGLDKTIRLWSINPQNYNLTKTIKAHSLDVRGLTFSPDGKILASASTDRSIKLWTNGGKQITTLRGHMKGLANLKFSPDGKFLASFGEEKSLKLWDLHLALYCEELLPYSCNWIRNYLATSPDVDNSERYLCSDLPSTGW